jgi:hypothetical protein
LCKIDYSFINDIIKIIISLYIENIEKIENMPIKVFVETISYEELQDVLDYYNATKSIDEEPLELLDRCEGGFQIKISHMKNIHCDENRKIKQLRWSKGYLVSQYINFTQQEQNLLYDSLVYVLGANNVQLEE